ncbi:MAG: cell division protein FtsZ [Patescibacteria group bacterium]
MAEIKPQIETFAKIKVVGVGGSGGSAVNRMITSKIRGVEFIVMNTDVQALHHNMAPQKLHIGKTITRGLGAGMDPEVGLHAAEENENEIRELLKGADMVFITCGLGGGTGSGAGPFVASIAKEEGALTVAVVTKPFSFEGSQRKMIADQAYEKLSDSVDTIITIPNDRILQIIDRKTSFVDAFAMADEVLRQGVQGISELITTSGLINVDFADVRAIMMNRGSALMGIGHGHGDNRAAEAAKAAVASPLLEVSIDGAKGVLFTITGGSNLGMYEVSEAAKVITQSADPQAKIIFGAIIDETMKDEVKITVIATGFDNRTANGPRQKSVFAGGTFSGNARPASFGGPVTAASPAPEPVEKVPFSQPRFAGASSPAPTYAPPQPPPAPFQPQQPQPQQQVPQNFVQPPPPQPSYQPTRPSSAPFGFAQAPVHAYPSSPSNTNPAPEPMQAVEEPHQEPHYTNIPAPQPAVYQPHITPPRYSPAPAAVPPSTLSTPVPPAPKKTTEEDDIDIPTFIRKKMM